MAMEQMPFTTGLPDQQMAEMLRRSDRWMATLAHELRDPLSAMMMSLEELRAICANEPRARLTREIALDAAQHMARVIDDALDLCRAHRGNLRFRTEQVDLVKIVAAAIRNSQPILSRKKHQVSLGLPLGRVALDAHPTRMEQILTNLLTNSAKYTNPGGEISVLIDSAPAGICLRVRDNGIGIAPELIPHVFEPYWKGPSSDGLGIGLSLVKSLVELHGGTIAVFSEGLGKGSEFVVRFPADRCLNQAAALGMTEPRERLPMVNGSIC